ncbi:MAG TPA: TetR/AcrR family transcriptional regulator [Solirubrobacteraceae bacterium]|jgi:AcrR family transcriptional regulator|nr:TetR/AcrR family transcriptional regulator [Solirubrobacteraceae bacterium]
MLDRRRCAVALEPSLIRDPRRRALDAFVRTVARDGYDHTNIEEVLELAKVPEPVFYEHFEDKQDCMLAALDERIRQIEDAIRERVEASQGWSERVGEGLQALLEALARDPEGARLALVECLGAGEAVLARLHSAVASCVPTLEQGRDDPEATDTDHLPPQISEAVVGGIASILHRLALERNTDELPGLLPDLLYFALMPYLGHESALAISRRRSRAGTGSSGR